MPRSGMDANSIDQLEAIFFKAAFARLLGWISASVATVGITFNYGPDTAAKLATIAVGVTGMIAHQFISRLNLKRALKTPIATASTIQPPPPTVSAILPFPTQPLTSPETASHS